MAAPNLRWALKHPRICVATVAILALMLLVGGSRIVSAQKSKAPPIVVLGSAYKIPPQKPPLPDRWIPHSWGWLWRFKEAVLGKAKVVSMNIATYDLDSVVLGMQGGAEPEFSRLMSHPDFTSTNGQKVWLLPNSKIRELQKRFAGSAGSRSSFRAGITTADRCQATLMTILDTRIGQADVLPLVRPGTTELTFILTDTTPVPVPLAPAELAMGKKSKVLIWPSQTNAVAALKLQLPPSTGFFLLDSQRKTSNAIETAVLVTVDTPANSPLATRPAGVVKRAN